MNVNVSLEIQYAFLKNVIPGVLKRKKKLVFLLSSTFYSGYNKLYKEKNSEQ